LFNSVELLAWLWPHQDAQAIAIGGIVARATSRIDGSNGFFVIAPALADLEQAEYGLFTGVVTQGVAIPEGRAIVETEDIQQAPSDLGRAVLQPTVITAS